MKKIIKIGAIALVIGCFTINADAQSKNTRQILPIPFKKVVGETVPSNSPLDPKISAFINKAIDTNSESELKLEREANLKAILDKVKKGCEEKGAEEAEIESLISTIRGLNKSIEKDRKQHGEDTVIIKELVLVNSSLLETSSNAFKSLFKDRNVVITISTAKITTETTKKTIIFGGNIFTSTEKNEESVGIQKKENVNNFAADVKQEFDNYLKKRTGEYQNYRVLMEKTIDNMFLVEKLSSSNEIDHFHNERDILLTFLSENFLEIKDEETARKMLHNFYSFHEREDGVILIEIEANILAIEEYCFFFEIDEKKKEIKISLIYK